MIALALISILLVFTVLCVLKFLSLLVTLAAGTAFKLAGRPFDADDVSERVFRVLVVTVVFVVPGAAGFGFGIYYLFREYGTDAVLIILGGLGTAAAIGLFYWAKWVWKTQ